MEGRQGIKPVKVSPIIKLVRWNLLIYGVYWGHMKWNYYHRIQTQRREEYEKIRPAIEARKKAQHLADLTDSLKTVAAAFEIELPPDWVAEGL